MTQSTTPILQIDRDYAASVRDDAMEKFPDNAVLRVMRYIYEVNTLVLANPKGWLFSPVTITPCLMGHRSAGKTSAARQFAHVMGMDYRQIAVEGRPEAADFLGIVMVVDGKQQVCLPPWWPKGDRPTLINFDDYNRAMPSVLPAIAQLALNAELLGHMLPPGSMVVVTANPPGGEYQVTEQDAAMSGRVWNLAFDSSADQFGRYMVRRNFHPLVQNMVRKHNLVQDQPVELPNQTTDSRQLEIFDRVFPFLLEDPDALKLAGTSLFGQGFAGLVSTLNDTLQPADPEAVLADPVTAGQMVSRAAENNRSDIMACTVFRLGCYISEMADRVDDAQLANVIRFTSFLNDSELSPLNTLLGQGNLARATALRTRLAEISKRLALSEQNSRLDLGVRLASIRRQIEATLSGEEANA